MIPSFQLGLLTGSLGGAQEKDEEGVSRVRKAATKYSGNYVLLLYGTVAATIIIILRDPLPTVPSAHF